MNFKVIKRELARVKFFFVLPEQVLVGYFYLRSLWVVDEWEENVFPSIIIILSFPDHLPDDINYFSIGFYSWRNTTKGSWFMQSLCAELDENGKRYDLLTLLTFVSQRVAYDFESNTPDTPTMHQQKQIPCKFFSLKRHGKIKVIYMFQQQAQPLC